MLRQTARASQSSTKGKTANDPTFLPWGSPGGQCGPWGCPGAGLALFDTYVNGYIRKHFGA